MSTVLITGASRGIGAQCALAFAKAGCDVALNYCRSEEKALALVREIEALGVRACAVQADVADSMQVKRMFETVRAELGTVDVLVNNAGVAHIGLLTDMTDDEWRRVIDTDLSGTFYCCRESLSDMIRAHSGVIVNIASMWGEVGASCEAAYSAAKAGVIGLTKALAKEVGPSGVRVNAVSPGVVMTDMMAGFSDEDVAALKEETPLIQLGMPEDIADAVIFLASEKARFITGQVLSVNGGMVI
ncbi:elongation factor P 5-aminopentanone reductase [uncultured Ruminococcus sp.]|uniref:elongation factor P 5-aminopentanone reductase n=1 Tax=uncultured Ruminococcus sp. TaxID=165186 RepID=UPI00292EB0D9|nr:SDR family oxidoreductase [uncultured Ruminococcus sp.]